ncbi:MAG: hypothetical protein ACREMG_04340 [Gemmatimonadales bacterium]
MRPPPELWLPRRRRTPWIAIGLSVAIHAVIVRFGWIEGRVPEIPHRPPQLIVLSPPAAGREAPMPFQAGSRADGQRGRGVSGVLPVPPLRTPRPQMAARAPRTDTGPRADSGAIATRRPRPAIGRIGPDLAEGRLWVRPLPLPPRELAERLNQDHVELVDSAVTAIVQAFLDSIANDPGSRKVGLPSWTTKIAGKKFGIDSSNIYIAGLKIPAAVLALLPIGGGNVDQNRAYNHLMDMRADLLQAAQRSQNMAEFKEVIRGIRERKERQREFERNQRTPPEPTEPAEPAVAGGSQPQ